VQAIRAKEREGCWQETGRVQGRENPAKIESTEVELPRAQVGRGDVSLVEHQRAAGARIEVN
jgi:hypothetical protein